MRRIIFPIASLLSDAIGIVLAALVRGLFELVRLLGADRASRIGGAIARRVGRWLPVDRVGQANLAAAYPEMLAADRRAILDQSWDNLGRTGAEYPFLQDLFDFNDQRPDDPGARCEVVGADIFNDLRDNGRTAIVFAAHTGNWELIAVAAERYGLDTTIVFRPPNSRVAGRVVAEFRAKAMGKLLPSGPGAAIGMVAALERGGILGMLADQHLTRGVVVPFFGRPVLANPVLAKLARRFECPVHGARAIRLPDGRFRLELTPALDLPRDAEGLVDVDATTALIAQQIEGWVREYPGQWLWLHRRWRVPARSG